MLFQAGCLKLLLAAEHLQPGCFSVPACGSLRLGCASASSISGSTAVTLVWPSSRCLFTCGGMQSYVSPNLSETTCPVTQTTGKRRNMALVASDGTCQNPHAHRKITRLHVAKQRECCTLSEVGVTVKAHFTYTCWTHTPGVVQWGSYPHRLSSVFGNSASFQVSTLGLVSAFKWGQSFCPKEFLARRPPMVDLRFVNVRCALLVRTVTGNMWFLWKYLNKENWQIYREEIRYYMID